MADTCTIFDLKVAIWTSKWPKLRASRPKWQFQPILKPKIAHHSVKVPKCHFDHFLDLPTPSFGKFLMHCRDCGVITNFWTKNTAFLRSRNAVFCPNFEPLTFSDQNLPFGKIFPKSRVAYTVLVLEPSPEQFFELCISKSSKMTIFVNFSSDVSTVKTPL